MLVDEATTRLIENAADEAYERGLREGRRRGIAELHLAADGLRTAVGVGAGEIRRAHADNAAEVVDLAIEIARFVIGAAPPLDGVVLRQRIAEALTALDGRNLTVAVSAHDRDAIAQSLAGSVGLEVTTDPDLAPGEARLSGPWGSADLTREIALDAARSALT